MISNCRVLDILFATIIWMFLESWAIGSPGMISNYRALDILFVTVISMFLESCMQGLGKYFMSNHTGSGKHSIVYSQYFCNKLLRVS